MPEVYKRRIHETKVPGKPLGRHVEHDPRSLAYQVQASGALQTVYWDRKIAVLDQGELGSCTGNAATGALGTSPDFEALPASHAALDEAFAKSVYSDAEILDGGKGLPTEDQGSSGLSVAKVCKTRGLISGYLHATSIAAMNTALQSGPVIVGVNWYEGFDSPDPSTGLVKISGSVRGGHEFEVIGYDVTSDTYTAWNSWGASWGLEGRFTFTGATMARLLKEQGDCTQLLPLSVPAPTPTPVPVPVPVPTPIPEPVLAADIAAWWATVEHWAVDERHVADNKKAALAAQALARAAGIFKPATGATVKPGVEYTIGESGPENFTPTVGGGTVINVTSTGIPADDLELAKKIEQALTRLKHKRGGGPLGFQ